VQQNPCSATTNEPALANSTENPHPSLDAIRRHSFSGRLSETAQTNPQNKTDAQKPEVSQEQYRSDAESFLRSANKFHEVRAQYEGQSGIGKYLPKNRHRAAMSAAHQELGQQIQNHQFSQDPQYNRKMVSLWLATASDLPPNAQKAIFALIASKLTDCPYQPEVLTLLNKQAKDNPQVAAIRNTYVDSKQDSITEDFSSTLNTVLKGSMKEKTNFIAQFEEGNQSFENKNTTQIRNEQAAIKALLANNDLTPSNRVFLQQLSLAYEIKLNENNPRQMIALASQFVEQEKPLLQQVAQNISQTEGISDAQKQEISDACDMAEIASKICNATFPRTKEAVDIPKFKTKEEAYLKIYGNHVTQGVMRLNSLMQEMKKQAFEPELKVVNRGQPNAKLMVGLVANELQGYISLFSSNTALYTARVEEASTKELQSFNTTGLISPKDSGFIEFDKKHSLTSLTASPSENLKSLQTITDQLSQAQSKSQKAQLQNQFAAIIKHTPIPNTSPENQQIFLALLKGIYQCPPNNQPALLHALHDQLQKSVEQANPASEVNKLLLQQMNLGIEAMGLGNDPQKLIKIERQILSNCIHYLTNQLNSPIDNQHCQELLTAANIFAQMAAAMIQIPPAAVNPPYASKDEALLMLHTQFSQDITRLPLLMKEIARDVEKDDQNHLRHALEELKTVAAHMIPMLELAQARVDRMTLKEINTVGTNIISAASPRTQPTDEKYGITPEMRRQAGGNN
jgi:hypothetical protein